MKCFHPLLLLSAFLLLSTSCKEKEEKVDPIAEKPKAPEVTISPEEKRLKEANKKLGWIMQDMEVPEYKLDRLLKKGEFLSDDFMKYANEVIKNARKLKEIDHPDTKLVGLGKEMLTAIDSLEAAVASKSPEKLKGSWGALTKKCAACHKDYKKGGGGY